eukprot:c23201_g1_i4 orf=316-576(-)
MLWAGIHIYAPFLALSNFYSIDAVYCEYGTERRIYNCCQGTGPCSSYCVIGYAECYVETRFCEGAHTPPNMRINLDELCELRGMSF